MDGTVWWSDFCGNRSIYDAFWSPALSLETNSPDLTVCMQKSVLLWIPVGLLWGSLPLEVYRLKKQKTLFTFLEFSKLNFLKMLICSLMTIVSVISFGITCHRIINQGNVEPADITYDVIRLLTMVLVCWLTRWQHMKGQVTSSYLSIFWMLYTITGVIMFRSSVLRIQSQIGRVKSVTGFILDTAFFVFLLVEFIASFFADSAVSTKEGTTESDEKMPLLPKSSPTKKADDSAKLPVPELSSSFWMKATFQWMWPAILRSNNKTVHMDDLYEIRPEDTCKTNLKVFNAFFKKSCITESSGAHGAWWVLMRAIFETACWPLLWLLTLKIISVGCFMASPQILRLLLDYIESEDAHTWKAWLYASFLFVASVLGSVSRHNYFYLGWNSGMKARSVINAAICKKALMLSEGAKKAATVGEMVTLLSVDAQKIQDMIIYSNTLLDVPLHMIFACLFVWFEVGWTSIAGILVLVILTPINALFFANLSRKVQIKQMEHKDNRLKLVNEMLNGIKILKLYAWESPFATQAEQYRNGEVKNLKLSNIMIALCTLNLVLLPYVMSLAIFAVYVLTSPEHILRPDTAFVSLSYINTLLTLTSALPMALTYMGQGIVSGGRLGNFLAMDELNLNNTEQDTSIEGAVQINDAEFSWDAEEGRSALQDINLHVKKGELVAVVGQVGAGKSSLVSAILGEITKVRGQLKVNGKFGYIAQEPWIQNATLRDNILFGSPYNHRKYKRVIDACALKADLESLPGGDFTEIGEKGINLSGGQKARVSLARAVYQDEDIYLLDDPLSAVDAHVGKHIFDKVIGPNGILKNKTRILVTHAITFLPRTDSIIVLHDGYVRETGQYEELLECNGSFAEYLRTYLVEEGLDEDSSSPERIELHQKLSALPPSESESDMTGATPKLRHRKVAKLAHQTLSQSLVSSSAASTIVENKSHLIEQETAAEGKLSNYVIWAYVKAGGLVNFVIIILSMVMFAASQVLTNIWLSNWTNDVPINGSFTFDHASYRLGVYGGLGILQAISAAIMMIATANGCTNASRGLHETLLDKILRAPMSFFYTTPLGRIINRFSKDMDMVDSNVPIFLMSWMFAVAPTISSIILISYTTPLILVFLAALFIPYIFMQRIYITYASQLKRLDSIHRSPIYAHFEESVNGASSIRAYRRQEAFIARAEQLVDNSQRPFYLLSAAQRWLGMTLETLGAVVIFCASILATLQTDSMEPGLAGMSVSYAIQLTSFLNIMVRWATELETYMISVERIDEYSQIESEAPLALPRDDLLTEWPSEGAIDLQQYSCRYRPGLDLVLSGVSISIKSGEKVGVVGRTGAGKSSLTLALFRIIEAAEGQIVIDGEDVSQLGLHQLRSRLTVIPQDPVMFSGSLRMNLDPSGTYGDLDLWLALEHAHLKSFVETLNEGLDYNCGEGGSALSMGQRQLVCLARALLRRSKVLILDEATAAVDLETDALIQTSIRTHFAQSTVLTVAHRLNTVLDYDKILVLDQGRVKEFDSPTELLASRQSIFYSLAKEAGLA